MKRKSCLHQSLRIERRENPTTVHRHITIRAKRSQKSNFLVKKSRQKSKKVNQNAARASQKVKRTVRTKSKARLIEREGENSWNSQPKWPPSGGYSYAQDLHFLSICPSILYLTTLNHL